MPRVSCWRPARRRPPRPPIFGLCASIQRLDKLTQDKRRQLLEATCAEPVVPGRKETFAAFPLSRLETKHLRMLRDRKAHVPSAQVNRVKAIKALFKWGLAEEKVPTNPARDLTVDAAPPGGHHSWTVEEVRQFEERHPIGTKARLALAMLLWTGVRRSDLVQLGRQHVRDGLLKFTQQKPATVILCRPPSQSCPSCRR